MKTFWAGTKFTTFVMSLRRSSMNQECGKGGSSLRLLLKGGAHCTVWQLTPPITAELQRRWEKSKAGLFFGWGGGVPCYFWKLRVQIVGNLYSGVPVTPSRRGGLFIKSLEVRAKRGALSHTWQEASNKTHFCKKEPRLQEMLQHPNKVYRLKEANVSV